VIIEAPTEEAPAYYVEEFDGEFNNCFNNTWGNENVQDFFDYYTKDGALTIDHNQSDLSTFLLYEPYIYTDVRLDVAVETLSSDNSAAILVCRYDPNLGRYEYRIENDGEWYLFYYDYANTQEYTILANEVSTAINMGKNNNIYTVICQGGEFSLYINGQFTYTIEHEALTECFVGFGLGNFEGYPLSVKYNWFEISEP
jgi:hypothetical protein